VNWPNQHKLDKENQQLIDSLFDIHKSYIGKTHVGNKFEVTM